MLFERRLEAVEYQTADDAGNAEPEQNQRSMAGREAADFQGKGFDVAVGGEMSADENHGNGKQAEQGGAADEAA